jgi:hypothetical protein
MDKIQHTAPMIVNMAKDYVQEAIEKETPKGWVNYGDNNLFPQYLIDLYNTSSVHGSLTMSIAFTIAGKEFSTDLPIAKRELERLKLDDIRSATALDLKLHGGFFWEVVWSVDRTTIARVNHLPFENCRLAVANEEDVISGIYYSKDWADTRKKKNTPVYIPMFNKSTNEEEPSQVLFMSVMTPGSAYYPKPDYYSGLEYIECTRQISHFYNAFLQNGMFPGYMIHFNNGVPDPEEQIMIKNQWEKMSGTQMAGKRIFTFNESQDRAPKVDLIPLDDADKKWTVLSEESRNNIMISHRVTSPLLFGIRESGGLGSNSDELKQAFKIFKQQVIEPYQRLICDAVELLLKSIGIVAEFTIVGNDILTLDEQAAVKDSVALPSTTTTPTDTASAEVKVSDITYNGAQIASALDIVAKVKEGILTTEQAIVFLVQFLQLPVDVAKSMFTVGGDAVTKLESQKKKVKLAIPDSFEPTQEMADEAELGLKWREEYGRGGTEVGVARARDISNRRNLSFDTVQRMNSYFARHEVDKQAEGWNQGEEGFASAGRIAWQLWGGDAGRDWAAAIIERYKTEQSACEIPHLSEEDENWWCSYLEDKGEIVDEEEWELIEAEPVDMASVRSYADPNEPSEMDSGLYKIRYSYSKNLSANSRKFCRQMVAAAKAGIVYRYEDLNAMSDDSNSVNANMGHNGSTYSIWLYKGSVNCKHHWERRVYFRKREKGRFLADKGLKNSDPISVAKAIRAGMPLKDIAKDFATANTATYDLPNHGRYPS